MVELMLGRAMLPVYSTSWNLNMMENDIGAPENHDTPARKDL